MSKILSFIFLLASFTFESALASTRIALVIGNADYETQPLSNPKNDANDVSKVLSKYGFDTTVLTNATQEEMQRAIQKFGEKLNKDTVGLFYYSGHGVQYNGENYLVPISAMRQVSVPEHLQYKAVNTGYILNVMKHSGSRLNMVFLDACRNNPFRSFTRSMKKGLARVPSAEGVLISYATAPGRVALDGAGRNSPYTTEFLNLVETPNLPIELLLKEVRTNVRKSTNGQQSPWYEASIEGDFYFSTKTISQVPTQRPPIISNTIQDSQEHLAPAPSLSDVFQAIKNSPYDISSLIAHESKTLPSKQNLPRQLRESFKFYDNIGSFDEASIRAAKSRGIAYYSYIPYSSRLDNDFNELLFSESARNYFRDAGNYIKSIGDPLNVVNSCCTGYTAFYHLGENDRRFLFILSSQKQGGVVLLAELNKSLDVLRWYNLSSLSNIMTKTDDRLIVGGALNDDNDIYFCLSNGQHKGNDNFVVKIELTKGIVDWVSPSNTCNTDIAIRGDKLVTAYGGTDIDDYAYLLRTDDGVPIGRKKLPTAADFIAVVGNDIYGTRYYETKFKLKIK